NCPTATLVFTTASSFLIIGWEKSVSFRPGWMLMVRAARAGQGSDWSFGKVCCREPSPRPSPFPKGRGGRRSYARRIRRFPVRAKRGNRFPLSWGRGLGGGGG